MKQEQQWTWKKRELLWNYLIFDLRGITVTIKYFILNRMEHEKNIPLKKWIDSIKESVYLVYNDIIYLYKIYYKKHINKD